MQVCEDKVLLCGRSQNDVLGSHRNTAMAALRDAPGGRSTRSVVARGRLRCKRVAERLALITGRVADMGR
jgi:hypothetical protein